MCVVVLLVWQENLCNLDHVLNFYLAQTLGSEDIKSNVNGVRFHSAFGCRNLFDFKKTQKKFMQLGIGAYIIPDNLAE